MGLFDGGIFGGGFGGTLTTTTRPTIFSSTTPWGTPTNNLTGGEIVVIGEVIAAVVAVGELPPLREAAVVH